MRYGFLTLDLNRIQIAAGTENRGEPCDPGAPRLQVRGMRARENLYGNFIDHAMYSLLRSDFDRPRRETAPRLPPNSGFAK